MQTQVIDDPVAGLPWLQRRGGEDGVSDCTTLDPMPFTIGRSDSAELQIDSIRVSREHVTISREGDAYRVRDLGSTNGTFLNGLRIEEETLADGDLLMIADVEFTFFSGAPAGGRNTATQVMDVDGSEFGSKQLATEIIRSVRHLQETATQRWVRVFFQPIVGLEGVQTVGYEAFREGEVPGCRLSEADRVLQTTECRLTGRLRRLGRLVAVEEAARLPEGTLLLMKLDASELGDQGLIDSLNKLHEILSGGRRLVVELPDAALSDVPHCREFRTALERIGIGIACDGTLVGGKHSPDSRDAGPSGIGPMEIRPDFLKLGPAVVQGLQHSHERRRQVQSVVRAGREIGCKIIAAGIDTEEDANACRQLGCEFGQGDLLGTARPILRVLRPEDPGPYPVLGGTDPFSESSPPVQSPV